MLGCDEGCAGEGEGDGEQAAPAVPGSAAVRLLRLVAVDAPRRKPPVGDFSSVTGCTTRVASAHPSCRFQFSRPAASTLVHRPHPVHFRFFDLLHLHSLRPTVMQGNFVVDKVSAEAFEYCSGFLDCRIMRFLRNLMLLSSW